MKNFYSLLFIFICCTAANAQFTKGNIVISQITDDSALGSAVEIKEFSPSAAAQDPEAVPTFALNQNPDNGDVFSVQGRSDITFKLGLSLDGKYLVLGGYNGVASDAIATLKAKKKTIVKIDALTNASYSSNNTVWESNGLVRDVLSTDGTQFWTTCHFNGLRYIASEDPTSTTVSTLFANATAYFTTGLITKTDGTVLVVGFDSTTTSPASFVWSPVDTTTGAVAAGTAVPYQPAGATTLKANGFKFFDLDATANWNGTGYDVLYVSQYGSNTADRGVYKYYWNGSAWVVLEGKVFDANLNNGFNTMTAVKKVGGGVTFYALTQNGQTPGNRLVSFDDTAAYNAAITIGTSYKTLSTAAAGKVFKGISLAPTLEGSGWTLSVADNELDSKFQVWPNPSQGEFNILNSQDQGVASSIEITTVTGQVVASQKLNAGTTTIRTNGWSAGVYFLKATSNGTQTTKKIIIQ